MYREMLAHVPGIRCLGDAGQTVSNYSYFPILVEPGYALGRDALYDKLKTHGIYARRYFYPLITDFPMYRGMPSAQPGNLPVATSMARQVLCLPIYPNLPDEGVRRVVDVVAGSGG